MERKVVTVLFADIVGSTELVDTSDPEVVRRRVTLFFEKVAHCIEAFGGTVEKYAGDAVMAAFGIPVAHEDDAERAGRAALAIVEGVRALELEVRVGIETGEVVTDARESSFATGGPVHIAARLQGEAAPGEILLGPAAHRLTASLFSTEPVGSLTLRGFATPVEAWRLVGAEAETGRELSIAAPFVGREIELELLENTWSRVLRDRRAHLFTIYGQPGVGKSRLAREFVAGLEGSTVLVGRSRPYGESITYWPLAEMVKVAAGIADDDPSAEAVEKLREQCAEDAVADLLALAAGVLEAVQGERSAQEIAWAAHTWACELADAQPLVLAFEDIHWAEERLLDLIEHLADRIRDVPVLILALARDELLDVRPGWGGGRVRATAIELESLPADESETLVDALLDGLELSDESRRVLLAKTEGNPLFLEETVRMIAENGSAGGIPDTVQALIAARIDRLPASAKEVLRRASVIGRVFWGGAIERIMPDDHVQEALEILVVREFLTREDRSTIRGEQAYRFKHVLIREVAYTGLTKVERAALHEAFAGWLKERAGDELIEIRAYHLDHASDLHEELDGGVPPELAAETAIALQRAGRRALAREANRTARRLLKRAVELAPTLERRYDAARAAWRLRDMPTVSDEMELVRELAQAQDDPWIEGQALTALSEVALMRDADLPRSRALAEQALELLGDEDSEDRFDALMARARIGWWLGDLADDERHLQAGREVARALEREDLEAAAVEALADVHVLRLELERAEELVGEALVLAEGSGGSEARAWALVSLSRIDHLRGDDERALDRAMEARDLFNEMGIQLGVGRTLKQLGVYASEVGEHKAAERHFRESIRVLEGIEDRGTLCETQRSLAQLLLRLGRVEEAEQAAIAARATVGQQDRTSCGTTNMALAQVRAAQLRATEAEELFRESLADLDGTDLAAPRLEVLEAFAEFLRSLGRDAEAETYVAEALALRSGGAPVA